MRVERFSANEQKGGTGRIGSGLDCQPIDDG